MQLSGRQRQVLELRVDAHIWKCIERELAIANGRDYYGRARRLLGSSTLGDAAAAVGLSTSPTWAPCCLQNARPRKSDNTPRPADHAGVRSFLPAASMSVADELPAALRALRVLRDLSAAQVARAMHPRISTARLTQIERAERIREDTRARVHDAIERAERDELDRRRQRASALLLAQVRS